MKSILFHLGPIAIYSYGAFMALAFLISVLLLIRRGKKMGIEKEIIYDGGLWSILGGILGARITYVILNWSEFQSHPLDVIMIQKGGLAYFGGFLGGVLAFAIYVKLKDLSLLKMLDLWVPAVAMAHAIGRVGCFLNGCCFGTATKLCVGVHYPAGSLPALHFGPDHRLHPTQFYESALLMGLSFLLTHIDARKSFTGQTFSGYLMLYPVIRFSTEFIRGDRTYVVADWLTTFQAFCIALFLWGAVQWICLKKLSVKNKVNI